MFICAIGYEMQALGSAFFSPRRFISPHFHSAQLGHWSIVWLSSHPSSGVAQQISTLACTSFDRPALTASRLRENTFSCALSFPRRRLRTSRSHLLRQLRSSPSGVSVTSLSLGFVCDGKFYSLTRLKWTTSTSFFFLGARRHLAKVASTSRLACCRATCSYRSLCASQILAKFFSPRVRNVDGGINRASWGFQQAAA